MRVVDKEALKPCLAMGFDLIPIKPWSSTHKGRPAGKMPRDKEWVVARYDRAALIDWIKKGGNVGVRLTRSQVVIDIDPKHEDAQGRNAEELCDELELELGVDLSKAPVVETGSGGWHVYLTKPEDKRVRNNVELFGGAIEFKSYGRQVLSAGSKHPSGVFYRWLRNAGGALPPCPGPLLELIAKPDIEERERSDEECLSTQQLRECLEQLDPTQFRDYEAWRNLMFSVHYACGGSIEGRDLFTGWSTSDPKYRNAGESIQEFWEYASDNRSDARTEKTLYYYVLQSGGTVPLNMDALDDVEQPEPEERDGGDEEDEDRELPRFERDKKGKIKHTIAENVVMACRHLGISIAHDVFGERWYVKDARKKLGHHFDVRDGEELDDRIVHQIALSITREIPGWTGDPSSQTMERAETALTEDFNPLQIWLESLEWDGKKRMDTWLIQASDLADTPYNRTVSRMLLYAAVGRALRPGIKFDSMVILEGPQGGYKSTLIRWLGGNWAADGLPPIGGHNYKDVISAMLGKWLIEIDELASMRKADVDVLKSFLSKTEDRVRLPYERHTRTLARQCVFIGTTNDQEYLRDMTGNRRFLPLEVGMIHDVTSVPREQLWAEAVAAWKADPSAEEISLPIAVRTEAGYVQESRRIRDPWEDRVEEFLTTKWSDETELSTEAIFFECLQMALQRAHTAESRRLSQVMQRLGWERCKFRQGDRQVRGYRKKGT